MSANRLSGGEYGLDRDLRLVLAFRVDVRETIENRELQRRIKPTSEVSNRIHERQGGSVLTSVSPDPQQGGVSAALYPLLRRLLDLAESLATC